jgi:hypothetical protein
MFIPFLLIGWLRTDSLQRIVQNKIEAATEVVQEKPTEEKAVQATT